MGTSNNIPYFKTNPNDVSMGNGKKKFDFICVDFCSFLYLGLGMKRNHYTSKFSSEAIAAIDDDESNTFLEDNSFGSDSSTLFADLSTQDVTSDETKVDSSIKHANMIIEEDKKAVYSLPTELTIGHFMEIRYVEDDAEDLPSRSIFSRKHSFEERMPKNEDESKSLNTLSTSRIQSSLDTKKIELAPSLDTTTWKARLSGLRTIETITGNTEERNERRKISNGSYFYLRKPYNIERVPSMVDTCNGDDQSLVSCMSNLDDTFPDQGGDLIIEGTCSWDRASLQKKRISHSNWVLQTQTSQSTPSSESFRSTVPVIRPVKSIDTSTTFVNTTEDRYRYTFERENIPFDEAITYSSKYMPIKETRPEQ